MFTNNLVQYFQKDVARTCSKEVGCALNWYIRIFQNNSQCPNTHKPIPLGAYILFKPKLKRSYFHIDYLFSLVHACFCFVWNKTTYTSTWMIMWNGIWICERRTLNAQNSTYPIDWTCSIYPRKIFFCYPQTPKNDGAFDMSKD